MSELRDKRGQTEAESIASFRARNFPRPHLTADIAVFEKAPDGLKLLLIRRGGIHPWAAGRCRGALPTRARPSNRPPPGSFRRRPT